MVRASFEFIVYLTVFSTSILYCIWQFYRESRLNLYRINQNDLQHQTWFTKATGLEDHPLDISDFEWQVVKRFFIDHRISVLICHSIGLNLVKLWSPKYLPWYMVTYTSLVVVHLISWTFLAVITANILIVFVIEHVVIQIFHNNQWLHLLNYSIFISSILGANRWIDSQLNTDNSIENNEEETHFLIHVSITWLNAKLLSCSIDYYHNYRYYRHDLGFRSIRLAYLFYLPPFFFGPIYNFDDFYRSMKSLRAEGPHEGLTRKILKLSRFIVWALIFEILSHFIYSSTFQYSIEDFSDFSISALCGLGYSLMILFYLKYFIIYGVCQRLSLIDGLTGVIEAPPECIGHVYQTSYLWKKFDRGLYRFLLKYFYIPLNGPNRSLAKRSLSLIICFLVIGVWHGLADTIVVWISLNIGLTFFDRIISFDDQRHCSNLKALIAAPLLMLAYLSNIIFLSNNHIGQVLVRKVLLNFPTNLFVILIFYCGCYACEVINQKIRITKNQTSKKSMMN